MFKLKLKNYRGFLNEEFNFSRVNILIGENSAGKSSIFKFLLALKQSLRSPNNRDYNLTLSGEETDLGNYDETIYNYEKDRNLYFAFEFDKDYFDFFLKHVVSLSNKINHKDLDLNKELSEERAKISGILGGKIMTPTLIEYELTNDLAEHNNIVTKISNTSVGEISIIQSQTKQEIYVKGDSSYCSISFKKDGVNYLFEEVEYEKNAFMTVIDGESLKSKIKQQFDNGLVESIYWNIAFLLMVQNYILNILIDIKYINPLLSAPAERYYLKREEKITSDIKDIKEVVYLLSGENFLKKEALEKFSQDYIKILTDFGILDDIKLNKDAVTRELKVVVGGMESNIKDVGFGVSLQMPILAQAMISERMSRSSGRLNDQIRKGETLLIEEPEVHLYPNLQAKFIETLLSIGNNNVYFIETHSEHIIRMLQLLVKTKKFGLKSSDVTIHYFKKAGKNMLKSLHSIDPETGKLSPNFPKGFYDVSYNLAFQLMD